MISHSGPATPLRNPWRELRKIDRDTVDYCTVMRRPLDHDADARLVNISPHGFMVRIDASFRQGEQVLISLPVVGEIRAKVAWALGGRIGGQFLTPIPPARYALIMTEASKPSLRWPA